MNNYQEQWAKSLMQGKLITESQGINDYYIDVVNELVEMILSQPIIELSEDVYQIIIQNYSLEVEVPFIKHFEEIVIRFGEEAENKSYYSPNRTEYNLNYEYQLINVNFFISFQTIDNELNIQRLRNDLAHELQHAYWYWNILMKGDNTIQQDDKRKFQYTKVMEKPTSDFDDLMKAVFYATEKDEISANLSELYDTILNYPQIDKTQLISIIEESTVGDNMEQLSFFLRYLNSVKEKKTQTTMTEIGESYKALLELNVSPSKAFTLLYQRVAYAYKTIVDKVYKVAYKALQDSKLQKESNCISKDKIQEMLNLMKKLCK